MSKTFNTNSTKSTTKIPQTMCSDKRTTNQMMTLMNPNAAGIDIGSRKRSAMKRYNKL